MDLTMRTGGYTNLIQILTPTYNKVSFDYKVKQFVRSSDMTPIMAHCWWRTVFDKREVQKILSPDINSEIGDYDPYFEFEEHCLALQIEEDSLLLLGNSYFETSFKDYNLHPDPYGYFKWYQKVSSSQKGKAFCRVDDQYYQEVPLNQILLLQVVFLQKRIKISIRKIKNLMI